MKSYYTDERNVQILISLLKANGIRKVVASPGTTNMTFIGSIQFDPDFEIFSSVDERSAAYIACGLSAESGEPVVLSCTGATASRNYLSGLTEAFYRKLPILAVTSTQHVGRIGQHMPQVIDRRNPINDTVNMSVQIPSIYTEEDEWAYQVMMNEAILGLKDHGGGPIHINLTTQYSKNYSVKELPPVKVIKRVELGMDFPKIGGKSVAIFVGNHQVWSEKLVKEVDNFCQKYDSVVICDHTSNYHGKFKVNASLICSQSFYKSPLRDIDILIHIGEVSGSAIAMFPKEVWRVSPDGKVRDTFKKLTIVYEMNEIDFFRSLGEPNDLKTIKNSLLQSWNHENERILKSIPELPFSNPWIAKNTISQLPQNSILHLGILNSLRSWDFFDLPTKISAYSNTGGFGIDGCVSSLLGASFNNSQKLYFGVVGDLAFFYDINSIGNRHVGNNIRLMIINNGKGTEFTNYNHNGSYFEESADNYIAASGHFGNKSNKLIKNYAENLGFEYISANSKKEYLNKKDKFLDPTISDKSIIFEVFTDSEDESNAIKIMNTLEISKKESYKASSKKIAKGILGDTGTDALKKIFGRKIR